MTIDFFALGLPHPQPRHSANIRGRGANTHVHLYIPPESPVHAWKEQVQRAARRAVRDEICTGPLRLSLRFVMPRPEGHFRKSGLRPTAPIHHTNERADIDNLTKAVMDALTDARVWEGDGQVCQLYAEKVYANPGEPTGCRVRITGVIEDHAPEGLFAMEAV